MVYKKYIKRNGKFYGPYIYHSKRVDGKVVSEYHGQKSFNKSWIFILFGFLFVILLGFYFFNSGFQKNNFTGQTVLDLNANYQSEQPIDGKVSIKLKEGELIPASTKIVFENAGNVYEFNLSDFVSEDSVEGNFYMEGKSISGNGLGYGLEGTKETIPTVYFTLEISKKEEKTDSSENSNNESSSNSGSENSLNNSNENSETSSENGSSVSENSSESNNEEVSSSSENSNVNSEETSSSSETQETQNSETQTSETNNEQTTTESDKTKEETKEENKEETKESTSNSEATAEETSPSVTGSIISGFLNGASNFFLRLTSTGNVVSDGSIVEGKTSKGNDYSLSLDNGQSVKLISGSVRTDSENISDSEVNLKIEDSEVTVSTDYSKSEKGFGKEYLGDEEKILTFDFSNSYLVFEEGDLNIKLVYEDEELLNLIVNLSEGNISVKNETVLNETELNVTVSDLFLTEKEKNILLDEFGNESVEITKAEKIGDRIIVKMELDKYWTQNSYDAELDNESLISSIDNDRIRWLKDLAKAISAKETVPENITDLFGNYSI